MYLLLLFACSESGSWARATQIASLDEAIGGAKAMARPGDFMLENDRIRIAVLGARYSLGPSPYGGTIADVDLQRSHPQYGAGHGNDRFAEMFPTVNMNLAQLDTDGQVTITADGSDGNAAVIRTDAKGVPFLSMLDPLWGVVGQPEARITTEYVLEPGAAALLIRTTASGFVPHRSEVDTTSDPPEGTVLAGATGGLDVLGLSIENGVAFGDFYLQGGAVDVFAPGIGFDEDRAVYDQNEAGVNTFQDPFEFDFVAGVADGVSYGIAASTGSLYVPLFTSSQTAAFGAGIEGDGSDARFAGGAAYTYERYLAVGKGDVGSVLDILLEARGLPYGEVYGHVLEEGTGITLSKVSVLVYKAGADEPYSQWLSDVGDDTQIDGSFGGRLPPGDYELMVHAQGRPDGERVPVTVTENGRVDVAMSSPRPGEVDVEVVDELGRPLPSRISFYGEDRLQPDLGDSYIPGDGLTESVFTPNGTAKVVLPPGEYTAVASRGLEYELDTSEPFTVTNTGIAKLRLQLVRSVDTTGYVSADFHVHAINSFDSGTALEDRVTTMVAQGVEFFSSSDHDYLTDYAPTVEDMGLEPWVKTAVGLETTTLEVGHFLGFPMAADTREAQGGAFDWTGMPAEDILSELDRIGTEAGYTPVRFVAHPRDGILGYFDQFGLDPYTGTIVTPTLSVVNELLRSDEYTSDFEALELLNGKRFELIRTPTQDELDRYAAGDSTVNSYTINARTGQEQEDLQAGVYRLGYGHEGQVDDWFTLLNTTDKRYTALGNSDTHGKYEIESGCPRNYVVADTDDPAELDEQAIADSVRAGHVVASYGPFIRFTANDGAATIGDDLKDTDGSVDLHIEVQAPTWVPVDRVELYQNGTLIHEWEGLEPDVLKLVQDYTATVEKDSWFVVIAIGDGDLAPVFTPVEMPPVQLQDVVTDALGGVEAVSSLLSPGVPIPRSGVVVPFALTNPIFVDFDGDGKFTPPGIPDWLLPPEEPVEPGE